MELKDYWSLIKFNIKKKYRHQMSQLRKIYERLKKQHEENGWEINESRLHQQAWMLNDRIIFESTRSSAAASSAAGGGGGRRPSSSGCFPPGGVMTILAFEEEDESVTNVGVFFAESGQSNGRTRYAANTVETTESGTETGGITITWNTADSKWYIRFNDLFDIARSSDLFSTDWEMVTENFPPVASTTPGEEFKCEWRYCFNLQEVPFSIKSAPIVIWFAGEPITQFPNSFQLIEGGGIFWDPEESSWISSSKEGFVPLGGTRESLPLGTFTLNEEQVLTIQAGYCDSQPPLPPLPPV